MSKIYEALEQAQKERKGLDQVTHVQEVPAVARAEEKEIYSFELEMEEEMVHLYHTIESLLPGNKKKIIQFIGSWEGEGTSTVAREFARIAIMKLGQSVLLLDADRHNPTQHFFCNVSPEYCLDDVAKNEDSLEKAFYQVGNTNLYVSLISRNSNSISHLFDATRERMWDLLRQRFDLVLIDSPPAAVSPDSMAIFRKVDGVILIVEADKTRWPVVETVRDRIRQHGGNILGIVLNKRKYYIPEFVYRRL